MNIQWHVSALGTYSTDLTPAETDESGQLVKRSSAGGAVRGGVSGVMHGKNSTLSGGLVAGYRYYARDYANSDGGVDAAANLGYATQVSLRTSAQIAARFLTTGYSWAGAYTPAIDIPIDGIEDPISTGFDSRTTSVGVSGGVTHMLTMRWGATASFSGYYTKRHSKSLVSSEGWRAAGGLNYQINASSSTGAGYSFAEYHSPDGFGNTLAHSLYWQFSKQFENRWNITGLAGVYYAQYDRLVAVPLDPVLAAIIGGQTILEPLYESSWGPAVRVTASRAFETSSVAFFYRRGITPGSAFYASAESDRFGAHYSLTTSERTNLGVGVSYNHNQVPGGDFAHEYYGGNVGFNYRIGGGFSFTAHASYFRQSVTGGNLDRDRVLLSAGITYGSGSRPVSLF